MPIPVPIPPGPLPVSSSDIARVESLVAAIAQVFEFGTNPPTGAPPLLLPDGLNPSGVAPLVIDTANKQLYYRQFAVALASTLVRVASATQLGVVELSSSPSDPTTPVALNRDEVSTTPGPNLVPRALSNGLLDSSWISGSGPTPQPDSVFAATCTSAEVVGNLVYISGSSKAVRNIDPTNTSKMLAVGCIISKSNATTCQVQSSDLVANIFSGLTPGRMYWAGLNSKPSLTKPTPPVGGLVLQQPIGFAIDTNLFLMQPGTNVFKIPG